jgi:hypothetical protein
MTRVHDQQPIQTLGPDRSHEAFGNAIRLRDLNRRPNNARVLAFEHGIERGRELGVVVANQKPDRLDAFTERPSDLPRLLRDPCGIGVRRTLRQPHASAAEFDEEEHVQPLELDGVDREESTATTLFAWVRRNSRHNGPRRGPAGPRCTLRRTFLTVFADTTMPRPFSLADDTLVTPPWILACESHNQSAHLRVDGRPTWPSRVGPLPGDEPTMPP